MGSLHLVFDCSRFFINAMKVTENKVSENPDKNSVKKATRGVPGNRQKNLKLYL